MTFAHPTWLFGFLALPLVALWAGWVMAVRRRRLARFAAPEFWPSVAASISWPRKRLKLLLRLAALTFLILAAARPQWGVKERPLVREGSDIMICLDVSTSMLARDIAPSRLQRAKEQIRSLIYSLKGDRVGLVLFAGEAFVQCPLTVDYGLAVDLLQAVGTTSVSTQGTRIGSAIQTARKAFDRSALGTKSIILVTDGEDQGSDPVRAAQEAAKDDIVIECVGLGSTEGIPILLPEGKYKEDRQGRKVTSRLDVETLRQIAQAAGGTVVISDKYGNMSLDVLYNELKKYERREIEATQVNLLEDRYQWPLGVALLLLIVEFMLGDRVREAAGGRWFRAIRRRAGRPAATAAAGLFLVLALLPALSRADGWEFGNRAARLCEQGNQAYGKDDFNGALSHYQDARVAAPENPVLDFNQGLALTKQGKFDEAKAAFDRAIQKAHDNPSLRAKAHYNSAVADYQAAQGLREQKELDRSIDRIGRGIDSNLQALALQPDYGDAKRNLNESRQLLDQLLQERRMRPPQQQSGDKQNQDRKDQQKDQQQPQSGKDQNKQDQQQKEDKDQQGKEDQSDQNKEGAGSTTPTPTNAPPSEQNSPQEAKDKDQQQKEQQAQPQESQQKEGQAGEQTAQAQQAPIGQMTPEDAVRLLSTLPDEDLQALQKALQGHATTLRLEKDW